MKCVKKLGWEFIEQDPVLRLELHAIEQQPAEEELVAALMDFYARIEGLVKLASVILEEDGRPVELEDLMVVNL